MKFFFFLSILISGCGSAVQKEAIPSEDYQRCLEAEKQGDGDEVNIHCGRVSQEIDR